MVKFSVWDFPAHSRQLNIFSVSCLHETVQSLQRMRFPCLHETANKLIFTYYYLPYQRLPGACNRSPGSKLLSITTQLHWRPSWWESVIAGHNFGRGPSNDYFIKVWFQLSNWFQTKRFVCEFPIGSYVKLSSAVGAILVEGPNCRTHFWKRTIQWLFHQNLVLIEQMVSDKKIFMGISHRVLC